jgi:hypothetical protein
MLFPAYGDNHNLILPNVNIIENAEIANSQFPRCQWIGPQLASSSRFLGWLFRKMSCDRIANYLLIVFAQRLKMFTTTGRKSDDECHGIAYFPLANNPAVKFTKSPRCRDTSTNAE